VVRVQLVLAYVKVANLPSLGRVIWTQVNVTMEYSRKIGAMDGPIPAPAAPGSERTMDFGSVFVVSAPKGEAADTTLPALAVPGQPQGTNVAEMLVVRGFATVVRHRDFEERSNYYEALLAAESKAIKGKKKIHSQKESPVTHVNDLSLPVVIWLWLYMMGGMWRVVAAVVVSGLAED
jgi:staphylococcal nuclease domain-containing protein 1